jgi:signal transduction histidine kinase
MRWRLGPELPLIHTDPAKLKIILKNLVNNAIKFTERGNVTFTAESRLDGVEFGVADTGVGIAPEALSYVFEAFRQGDGSMTRRHGGVGLGLHLVQRFTELLEGTVTVESTMGVGSTFRVWLPLRT